VNHETERTAVSPEREISQWLCDGGVEVETLEPLQGDLSTRKYFRARDRDGATFVVARYPPELREAQRRFRLAQGLLRAADVRVPEILREDPDRGLALLEDVGRATLYESRGGWHDAPDELRSALGALGAISRLEVDAVRALGSPELDAALLRRELEPPLRLFLAPHGLAGPEWIAALDALCAQLGAPPRIPCHRDLMARNLVPDGRGHVVVLDFQDLRLGPASYYLASLLNDSFFAAPDLEEAILAERAPAPAERQAYGRAVVQRSLKAVGTFLTFAERGERRHLPLVAPTLERVERWLPELPELAPLGEASLPRWRGGVAAARVC
jgi:aminoglycoside/choline kinase family phosphotransferase